MVRLLRIEQVHAFPIPVECGYCVAGEGSCKNQRRVIIQWAEAGIEVVAIRIDQRQRNDWNSHFAHCRGKFFDAAAGAAKTVPRIDARSVGMPEKIAMPLEEIVAIVDFDHTIAARTAPFDVERNFALPRWIDHATAHNEFSVTGLVAGEELIRGEDHVLE